MSDNSNAGDKRKQSLFFPEETLKEIRAEAQRTGRSLSSTVQEAWRRAHSRVSVLPGVPTAATLDVATATVAEIEADTDCCVAQAERDNRLMARIQAFVREHPDCLEPDDSITFEEVTDYLNGGSNPWKKIP